MRPLSIRRLYFPFALALGATLRILFSLHRHDPIGGSFDPFAYIDMAKSFAHWRMPAVLDHPPFYPLWLSVTYILPGEALSLALIAQALIGIIPTVCVYHLLKVYQAPKVGVNAAWWTAIDPFSIYFSSLFMSETLFTALLVAGIALFFEAVRKNRESYFFLTGTALGLACLTRSVLTPLLPCFVLGIPLIMRRTSLNRRVGLMVLLTLGVLVPMLSWSFIVYRSQGVWLIASVQKGWNSYEGANPNFDDPKKIEAWQAGMRAESRDMKDVVTIDHYFWEKTKAFYFNHPVEGCVLMVRKFFKFWRLVPYEPYSGKQRIISALFMIPLILFALVGLIDGFKDRDELVIWLGVFLLLYSILNTISWTQIRYRLPLHPLLALLAGRGVLLLYDRIRPHE